MTYKKAGMMIVAIVLVLASGAAYLFLHRASQVQVASVPFQGDARAVVQQSVLTRALGIEAPNAIAPQLDSMPQGLLTRDSASAMQRSTLWSLFFRGTLTKLGRLRSRSPLIVYYNPMVDVVVLQGCRYVGGSKADLGCQQLCAAPGEILDGAAPARSPAWLKRADPLAAMQRAARARMTAFAHSNPADAGDTSDWEKVFCSRQLQAAAELRLLDSASALAQLNVSRFTQAIARYTSTAARDVQRKTTPHVGATNVDDPVLALLTHLNAMSLSGAVSVPSQGWIIFLTPKQTGWKQAAVFMRSDPTGSLSIQAARLLTLSSQPG